ncbi:extracellular solute-binding protein [Actinoplanes xinjiangensis]|uniref:Carbohydrate ABC transporter substrate-binding protein (CUT1 family) n=1 Tax=Actinoplanes xinjiangensis TaxID=512350 RepID=A0A316FHL4_9ACTN|nr:extracellular solute-binding protein [Actinoplanes xinjiangensis]PWK48254.1 carbohydrate ABC transporter substrate-binding protein (CUT1 family) [Actinoplanes xinjiangensis]GIF38990.1 sugar ABC transporter substrate-binding protein [Actinoplanes xinjiangensis]
MISEMGRRSWLMLGAGLVAGAVLGGTMPAALRPSAATSGELVIVSGVEDGEGGARQALIDLWNQTHPDRLARIELVSGSADEQHDAMIRYAKGEEPVKADILNLDVTAIAEFAEFGHIAEWPAGATPRQLLAELLEKPRESCYYRGKLWALPFNADAGVLFARRGLLRPPPPTTPAAFTWTDIVAQRPPAGSATPRAAFAGQLDGYEGLTVNALEALWTVEMERGSAVGHPLGVSTDPAIWSTAVARLYGTPGDPGVVDPGSTAYRESETTEEFLHKRVVFMRNWPVAFRTLVEDSDQRATVAAADIVMTPLPGPGVLGGQNLAVVSGSSRGDDARDLITFLAGEPSQRLLMQVGGFAAATGATYDRDEIRAAHPYAVTIREAIRHSRQRLQTPYYPRFSEEIRTLVAEIRQNGGTMTADGLRQRLLDASLGRLAPR